MTDQTQSTPAGFHRPPRAYPAPVPQEPLRLAAPPHEPTPIQTSILQVLFPVVGGFGMVGFALVFGRTAYLYIAFGMIAVLLLFSIGMRVSQKRGVRKRAAAEARRYAKYLREQDQQLATAGELQRQALARLYPDPGRLWTLMVRRTGVWERRPDHEDFLHVRIGKGIVPLDRDVTLDLGMNPMTEYQPHPLHEARRMVERRSQLRNEAVVRDLSDLGILAITGDRERSRAWARGLMVQLAAFRAPQDLRIVTAFPPEQAGDWEWGKWLPHQRIERGQALPALTLARTVDELDALLEAELRPRLEQLRRIAETNTSGREVQLVAHELVVVLDGYHPKHPANDLPAFRELVARARELKAVLVLLCDHRDDEPSSIDARITIPERGLGAWELAGPDAPRLDELSVDAVDVGTAEAIARALTPLRLEEGGDGERSLAAEVRLADLVQIERRPRTRSRQLRVPIGVQADGDVLELDLKQAAEGGMGPHGVLVGATGSGKSELLRSLVAGLAATHDTDLLSFVLIDFKGGAAFVDLAKLPHVAGLITNLQDDLTLLDRMRDALIGEQERRQKLLRDAGNVDDVAAYRTRREQDPSLPPLPDLLVIVDEFAELLAARPEMIDLFVSIGRVGRSLGIHLLMSSQRLDEGRLRGLESHLRYRICLRTYSAAESKQIIGTQDAYLLPSLPGLGYLKVDTEIYTQFRAALASTPYVEPSEEVVEKPPEVVAFDAAVAAGERAPAAAAAPEPAGTRGSGQRTDLQVLIERLNGDRPADAPPVHQVWLPPLAPREPLDAVLHERPWWEVEGGRESLRVPIGTVDRPTEQRTDPLVLDFAGGAGHLAVVGAPRTGKSTLMRSLAAAFLWTHTPDEVQLYAIDLGGGLLGALTEAPHVGGVAGKLDREAVQRVVRQLRTEIEDREERFRVHGVESMAEARRRRSEVGLPDVFLLVDGWATFKREYEGLDREIEDLAAAGLSFGVHVVLTANRWADIRPALLDNLGARLELKLNDPIDSDVSRAAAQSVPADTPGRGITGDALHFQAALPRLDGKATDEGLGSAFERIVAEAAGHWQGAPAEPIRLLPRVLGPDGLPAPDDRGVAIGIEERALEPVRLDLEHGDPHFMIFGDAETGKSSLLRHLALSLASSHGPDDVELVVVDVRRSLADLATLPHLRHHATTPPAIAEAMADLAARLASRVPSATPGAAKQWSGPQVYVLFDDYDLVSGPTNSPLAPLVDLLAIGRDIGLHVVIARRVGGSARGAYETAFSRVRELGSPGLLMSGDPGEGPLLGGQKAQPQPPGRGLLIRRGGKPLLVQTPLVGPAPAPDDRFDRPAPSHERSI